MKINILHQIIKTLAALVGIVLFSSTTVSDRYYPQDYFRSPVDHTIYLSGTFGELRYGHFHAGIDIKPIKTGIGEPIYAVADGFISRILVSPRGYGHAVYIDHPNGFTSVYGHLSAFKKDVKKFVIDKQYQDQKFKQDFKLNSTDFRVKKGQIIGYMGNSGTSFGPHLHFEIRDTKTEFPINPLLFGIKVKDKRAPVAKTIKVYGLNHEGREIYNENHTVSLSKGNYKPKSDIIEVKTSYVGIAIYCHDEFDGVPNKNGIYEISLYADEIPVYQFNFEKFSFDHTRFINAHTDYIEAKKRIRMHRCYLLPGNNLGIYDPVLRNGVIKLKTDGKATQLKAIIKDVAGNASTVILNVKKGPDYKPKDNSFNYVVPLEEKTTIEQEDFSITFAPDCFYEKQFISYKQRESAFSQVYSKIHQIHHNDIPVHNYFNLAIKPIDQFPESLKEKAIVAVINENDQLVSIGGKWDGEFLTTKARELGSFCITTDVKKPTLTVLNRFKNGGKASRFIQFKIADNLSGIASYEAFVDDKWILTEYDLKYKKLTCRLDRVSPGLHKLKIIVKDNCNNETIKTLSFVKP